MNASNWPFIFYAVVYGGIVVSHLYMVCAKGVR